MQPMLPDGRLLLAPLQPLPFSGLEVHDLPLGDRRVSVRMGSGDHVDVEVEGPPLDVEVAPSDPVIR